MCLEFKIRTLNLSLYEVDKSPMKHLILVTCFLPLVSLNAEAFGGGWATGGSGSTPIAANTPESKFRTFYHNMMELRATGAVDCNQTFLSSAHLMICNCANETAHESQQGKIDVARVVFSRAKSPYFPNTVKGVVCQDSAFSWMNGGFNSRCERLIPRAAPLLNHAVVREPTLSNCVQAVGQAAKIELVDKPTEIFALNYCNPRICGVASWCRNFPRSSGMIKRTGNHYFGFERTALRGMPSPGIPEGIVKLPGIRFLMSLFYPAKSFAGGFSVSKTFAAEKIVLDENLNRVLTQKYKGFRVYDDKSYSKKAKLFLSSRSKISPSAITGDYNGDGYKDVILLGKHKGKERIVAFISKGLDRYQDYTFTYKTAQKSPYTSYLVNVNASEVKFKSGKKRQAWQIETYGGAFESYYFAEKGIKLNDKKGFSFKKRKPKTNVSRLD